MFVFATQITPVVSRVMFSRELEKPGCCGCCHHTHLHCCVKTQKATDWTGGLLSVLWGKQMPPCLLFPYLDYRWWGCVAWVDVASEIWNHCASSATCFCDSLHLAWDVAFWPFVLVQWKSRFIKLGERSVGKGEAMAMHSLPCTSVQPWIRPDPSALSIYQDEYR